MFYFAHQSIKKAKTREKGPSPEGIKSKEDPINEQSAIGHTKLPMMNQVKRRKVQANPVIQKTPVPTEMSENTRVVVKLYISTIFAPL